MNFVPTVKDFITSLSDETHFDFMVDEDGDIFAYGHVDPEVLVSELILYDLLCNALQDIEEYRTLINETKHTWAVVVDDGVVNEWKFWYGDSRKDEEGSFPITYIMR